MNNKKYETIVKERMITKVPESLLGGLFHGKKYPHIFKELKDNFIDGKFPIKKSLKGQLTDNEIKYHYAEHLNSSQTMCIAYFKKFFEVKEYENVLIEILMKQGLLLQDGKEIIDAVFEHIPCTEEGTNFDFYLKMNDGRQITWEVKFTESDFGGTTKGGESNKYIAKYERIYRPMLRKCVYYSYPDVECDDYKCLKTGKLTKQCPVYDKCSINEFYKYYQIRRNILYAEKKGDYVLFLTPRENEKLNEGRAYIEHYASNWNTEYIRNIYWEDLLETTLTVVSDIPELFNYYTKFKEKYFE